MKTIWKYQLRLDDTIELELPKDFVILSVQT